MKYSIYILSISVFFMTTACEDSKQNQAINAVEVDQIKYKNEEPSIPKEEILTTEPSKIEDKAIENNNHAQQDLSQISNDTPKQTTVEKKQVKPKPKAKPKKKRYPSIEFTNYEHDFGEIEQGESIKFDFVFKNTGDAPLTIDKATATCGCTQPSFPFLDIMPGEEGYIGVSYYSVGKEGVQEPEISVFSNDKKNPIVKLQLKGFVHLPEKIIDSIADTSKISSPN